jgi:hypothetical protein
MIQTLLQDALGAMCYTLFVLHRWWHKAQGSAARLIIKYEDDYPLHVETQKDFDVVCNRDTDAFCQGTS